MNATINTDIPEIHVGIMAQENIQFCFNGNFFCQQTKQNYQGKQLCSYLDGKIAFQNQSFNELIFEPTENALFFQLIDVTIGINFHWERKENQEFKGKLKLIVENQKLRAINSLPVEDYLESVISSEMSATSSVELLKAHAVISRSWAIAPTAQRTGTQTVHSTEDSYVKWYERSAHTHFDVCADDHCQRYQGIARISSKKVQDALKATKGEVIMYQNQICDARFSKSCGGVSESFHNCWAEEQHDYLMPIADYVEPHKKDDLTIEENAQKWIRTSPQAFCNTTNREILSQVLNNYDQETTDFFRWKVKYTQAELSALVQRRSGIDFGEILDLEPIERGASGRLVKLRIIGTKRTLIVGKELEIRKWLSETHLYSSAFVIDKDSHYNFVLTGAGWGHGVGLCQIGAAVMGAKGYKYTEILKHYFQGAEIVKIYS